MREWDSQWVNSRIRPLANFGIDWPIHALPHCLIAIGALGFAAPAAAQTTESRPLVLPFAVHVDAAAPQPSSGAPYWLGEASAILLSDELERLGTGTFSRSDRIAAFERLQLPLSATLTHATMIRVGEILGAAAIIVGDVQLGQTVTVRARIIRLDAGQQLAEVTAQASVEDLFSAFDRLGQALAVELGRPASALPPGLAHPPLDAFENYVKGLVAATPAAQERFLAAALKSFPAYDRARLALWSVQSVEGAPDKALATARAVAATSPLSRAARFCAALSLVELKRYDEAFALLSALDQEHAAPVVSNALGVVQLRRGGTPTKGPPVYFFTRAADLDPDNVDYLFNLGYGYALANDQEGALYWLRQAVRLDPANGDTHLILSAVLTAANRTVEAQREFDLATLLGISHTSAEGAPGDRVPRGLERLRTDLDARPTDRFDIAANSASQRDQEDQAAFHLERGRRLFQDANDRDAIDELRHAIYLSPYQDEPHLLLGRLYLRGGRAPLAVDEFKLAIWCRETFDARLALGTALLETGQREAARVQAERALVLKPDSAEAKDLLKRIGGPGC
jgi:tetratricopeptide (TPR) repeat protein